MDKFHSLEISDQDSLSRTLTEENVRILEAGYFAIVYSSLKAEEWKWILMHYPDLLQILDENGRDVFRVEFDARKPGCVMDDRVQFGRMITGDGYATVTVMVDADEETDKAEFIRESMETGLNRLAEVEQMALAFLPESRGRTVRSRIVRL